MIRKRLNIVFFSILMIAATPQVMTNFSGYADALYHKAETEWLHFLLAFAQAEDTENGPALAVQLQKESACTLHAEKIAEPGSANAAVREKKSARSHKSRARSTDVAMAMKSSSNPLVETETVAGELRMEREARRHADRIITLLDDPAVVERNGRSKTEFLRVLLRSIKLGDGKAIRALGKEITAADKVEKPSVTPEAVSFEWTTEQPCEAASEATNDKSIVGHDSSEESTLDAR